MALGSRSVGAVGFVGGVGLVEGAGLLQTVSYHSIPTSKARRMSFWPPPPKSAASRIIVPPSRLKVIAFLSENPAKP